MPHLRIDPRVLRWLGAAFGIAVAVYLVGLGAWFLELQLVGDRTWWLFTVNGLALYYFLPLPLAIVAAAWLRSLPLGVGCLAGVAMFAFLWGGMLWPDSRPEPEGPVLTVMAYNVLGFNEQPEAVAQAIRDSGADIVGLSELNPAVARAIQRHLGDEYPHQLLEPQDGVRGSGVISRLPFRAVETSLDDPDWISPPTVVEVDYPGGRFLFVRVHSSSGLQWFDAREKQARLLSRLAEETELPLVVAGDFNASDLNDSYAILTEHRYDTWREVGTGLGNTFPGASRATTPGSSRPQVLGVDLPQWLIRIDYVFCSYDWQPIDARIGPWDGYSDHRPVIAEVALRTEGFVASR